MYIEMFRSPELYESEDSDALPSWVKNSYTSNSVSNIQVTYNFLRCSTRARRSAMTKCVNDGFIEHIAEFDPESGLWYADASFFDIPEQEMNYGFSDFFIHNKVGKHDL